MAKTKRVKFEFDERSLADVETLKEQGHFDMTDSSICSTITPRGVMGRERECVQRLFEILQADNDYFTAMSKLAMAKLRGPVDDQLRQDNTDAYQRCMDLRERFTEDHGGLYDPLIQVTKDS